MADVVYRIEVAGFGGGDGSGFNVANAVKEQEQARAKRLDQQRYLAEKKASDDRFKTNKKVLNTAVAVASMASKQALSAYQSTIAVRTGSSYQQEAFTFGTNLAMSFAGATIASVMTGNPLPLIGVGVTTGISALTSNYTANIKRSWSVMGSQETQRIMNYTSYGNNRTGGALY